MYTKEQIRKGTESALFNPNKKRGVGSPVDAILAEIERMSNAEIPYVQPLSVKIIHADISDGCELNDHVTTRKELRLTIEMAAAFVPIPSQGITEINGKKTLFSFVCRKILDGEISIKTSNTNIDPDCFLIPLTIQPTINSNKIVLDVVSYGDVSKYINGNLYINELLIKASIMGGSLIIKG